jgi:hypothetical protein
MIKRKRQPVQSRLRISAMRLAVTDGHDTVGFIIRIDGGKYDAFAADQTFIGEYPTQSAAMRALPTKAAS